MTWIRIKKIKNIQTYKVTPKIQKSPKSLETVWVSDNVNYFGDQTSKGNFIWTSQRARVTCWETTGCSFMYASYGSLNEFTDRVVVYSTAGPAVTNVQYWEGREQNPATFSRSVNTAPLEQQLFLKNISAKRQRASFSSTSVYLFKHGVSLLIKASAIWDIYWLCVGDCVFIQCLSSCHNSFVSQCVSQAPLRHWFPE